MMVANQTRVTNEMLQRKEHIWSLNSWCASKEKHNIFRISDMITEKIDLYSELKNWNIWKMGIKTISRK